MTLTINPQSYAQLLAFYQPKVIETEAENDHAISLASELEHKADRTAEESAILDLLVILIEKFEEERYPIPEASPHSIILHLLESNEMTPDHLVGVLGSTESVTEVVNGTFDISISQAKALANFFSVDVSLFIASEPK
ncbi:MAG: transcriptional regulator [Cyanothece sp. SIO2G6]|nr:transcriptional regulator [Cyanothece sp. SIO2G6]